MRVFLIVELVVSSTSCFEYDWIAKGKVTIVSERKEAEII